MSLYVKVENNVAFLYFTNIQMLGKYWLMVMVFAKSFSFNNVKNFRVVKSSEWCTIDSF